MTPHTHGTRTRIALWIGVAILAGAIFGVMLEKQALRRHYRQIREGDKLSWALTLIGNSYVDPISRDSLAELALPLILKELDPHSVYVPARDFAQLNEPLTGSFDGIGVRFTMLTDTVLVSNVIPGGPSHKAGIMAGDMILTVGDSLIAGRRIDQDKVVTMLRGPRGTTVRLGILRGGAQQPISITVTRGEIPLKSLEAAFILRPGIGYIRFEHFLNTSRHRPIRKCCKRSCNSKRREPQSSSSTCAATAGGTWNRPLPLLISYFRQVE